MVDVFDCSIPSDVEFQEPIEVSFMVENPQRFQVVADVAILINGEVDTLVTDIELGPTGRQFISETLRGRSTGQYTISLDVANVDVPEFPQARVAGCVHC